MTIQQVWTSSSEWLFKWLSKQRPEVVVLVLILAVIVGGTPWAISEVKSHIRMLTVENKEVTKLNNDSHERQMRQQLEAFERVHDKDSEARSQDRQLIRDLLRSQGVDVTELRPSEVAVNGPQAQKSQGKR